ncbi:hypothetical protein [Deinococcus arboris]|nr:hypothetical protein [Deinococcus arboris]
MSVSFGGLGQPSGFFMHALSATLGGMTPLAGPRSPFFGPGVVLT